jgi:CheY-like chemotaxis protein
MSKRRPALLERPIRRSALYACLAALAPMHGGVAPSGANGGTAPSPFSSPRRRVLLAEDNPFNQNFYQILLEQCGCDVDVVDSGLSALAAWRRKVYDLILMDGEMPEMDGYEATEKIRRKEREAAARERSAALGRCASRIPIIAITGHTYREARRKCLAAGMDDCLCKPFTIVQLGEKLDMWLSGTVISSREPHESSRMNSTDMP